MGVQGRLGEDEDDYKLVLLKPQTSHFTPSRRCGLYVSTGGLGPLVAYANKGAIRELIRFSACVKIDL